MSGRLPVDEQLEAFRATLARNEVLLSVLSDAPWPEHT
jgi:hypothetical protein